MDRHSGHEVVRCRQGDVVYSIATKLIEESHREKRVERSGSVDRVQIVLRQVNPQGIIESFHMLDCTGPDNGKDVRGLVEEIRQSLGL